MRRLILFLALCLILAAPAWAAGEAALEAAADTEGLLEAAPEAVSDALGELSLDGDLESGLERLLDYGADKLRQAAAQAAGSAARLVAIALLTSLAGTLAQGIAPRYVRLAGVLAATVAVVGDMNGFAQLGAETLHSLSDFSKALLPSMAAATAAMGSATAAAARCAATALFVDLLITAADRLVLPMLQLCLAVGVAEAALGEDGFPKGVTGVLKWLCTALLTALVLGFTGYLAVTGAVAGTADAVATRVAKTTISTALPVVGGILSDAAGALVAGAGLLRSGVGVFGLLAVAAICLAPVLRLGLQYLLLKLAGGLCAVAGSEDVGRLASGFGSVCGMLLGLVGAGAAMLFVSLIMGLQAVTGL